MKKIAIVSSLSSLGGTEISLINLLNSLPKNKYKIDLLLIDKPGSLVLSVPNWINIKYINQYTIKNYLIFCLKQKKIIKFFNGLVKTLKLKYLWKKYRTNTMEMYSESLFLYENVNQTYDFAISWFVPNSIISVYTLKKINAKNYVIWIHMDVTRYKMPFDAENIFSKYNKIYCVSKACKDGFDYKYPSMINKTEVYYNIINIDAIRKKTNNDIKIIDHDKFNIMTCGRLAIEKQPFLALKITKKLINDGYKDFRWIFIGDGPLRKEFEFQTKKEKLEEYIYILGKKENPFEYLKSADLYIQMSLHESFCLTLAEAQILQIPCLTTNFKSAYEILHNGKTGYILNNDWIEFYLKIRDIFDNKSIIKNLKHNFSFYKFNSIGKAEQLIEYINKHKNGDK